VDAGGRTSLCCFFSLMPPVETFLRVYVLDLAGNPAPGKVGVDGPYLKP